MHPADLDPDASNHALHEEVIDHFGDRDYSRPFPLPVPRVIPSHPSPTERYYDIRFFIPCLSDHALEHRHPGDQVVMIHSNRICLISLAPEHPVLRQDRTVTSIHFEGHDGHSNRLENKVSGRKKHGAQKLKERSVICRIDCSDGSHWHVLTGVRGKLVEVNHQLIGDPSLLRRDPYGRGYIAIVMTNVARIETIKEQLLTPEAYREAVAARSLPGKDGGKVTGGSEGKTDAQEGASQDDVLTPAQGEPQLKRSRRDSNDGDDSIK